jgi:hypothetical protein
MAKITPRKPNETVIVKTQSSKAPKAKKNYAWWKAAAKKDVAAQSLETALFLKENQQYRYRQAAIFARMYGNRSLFSFVGSTGNKMSVGSNLPLDRPTMNVVQSCIDTLASRIGQSRPRPIFLTDNGNYKERNLAKQLNNFIVGEFYQTKAYGLLRMILRDAAILGTGCLKIYKNSEKKVGLDRCLITDLLVDTNDGAFGDPRQLHQLKLVDRALLAEIFPDHRSAVESAEQAYLDSSSESEKTASDQVMVVESWHLPSSADSDDGMHVISCSSGPLLVEEYKRQKFPFVFLHFSPAILGFWGQGLAEQLMGTQVEINKLLMTISQAINLVGVPRVFVEKGSKVVKAHLNNQVGAIVEYTGMKPVYEVAPCVPAELYDQLQRLVNYAYQQSGISQLSAMGNKPQGLNSGAALREYNDTQSDRFADLSRRYDETAVELAYQIMDEAVAIAEEEGSYQTIYPNKDGTRQIDLPEVKKLKENPFVIQCFDASSLPRDPAGRLQKVTEMMQSGIISPQEGRRLLDYPDIEQVDKLANSSEERILKILDDIVEKADFTPPDPFMDLQLALQLVTQYYNLYAPAKLEEDKAQLLRDFHSQVLTLIQQAQPPQPTLAGGPANQMTQAVPEPKPTSELLPNVS